MSVTLSNGYKQPETGDRGNTFFPDLEDNIQRVNDHTHNGTNSEKLTAQSIEVSTFTINPGDWSLHTNGLYRSLVTLTGLEFDEKIIQLVSGNNIIYGDVEKVTVNTMYVYVNDNSLTVTVKAL